ncbi:MAG: SPFH domain-containing protein [Bacteroidaceae bacterium]|nr:SPFH domain-containing protein [Bacteroidaceae bacterium]
MALIKSIYWEQEDREELVYKFPFNNISLGSVLTVNESQEALFFKSGVLCDTFGAGRHTLSTANLPVLKKLLNLPSGGDTTFTAEVWFVSKLEKRNMYWGTGGLRIVDPYFQIPIKISARGQYGIRVSDSALFMKKLIGTLSYVTTELIEDQFRIDVIETVKVSIAKFMKENNVNINELGVSYKELSKSIAKDLQTVYDEYGVELLNFNVEDIGFDENDKGYQTVMEGVAEQAKLSKLGVSYAQQKQFDIAQTAAGNEGAGNFMGIGMGLSMGNAVGQMVSNTMQVMPQAPQMSSFYVAKNGQTTGPFTIDVIQGMIKQGEVIATTYVYKVGGQAWVLAIDDAELSRLFAMMAPPPPPPPVGM